MRDHFLVDYHIHTPRCGHASGAMRDYVLAAREAGLAEMGFADHFPLLHLDDPHLAMGLEEVPLYIAEVEALRAEFPDFPIRLGIEADYVPEVLDRLEELLGGYDFDYVYGSVHFVDGWAFDDPRNLAEYQGRDIELLYRRYFETLADAAECGLFDALPHPDLVKKFGFRPAGGLEELYDECLARVARAGLAVELNTSGLRRPVKEAYPAPGFLLRCRELGIPVTLGSDAHSPDEVGCDFNPALAMLEDAGYETVTVFEGREAAQRPLARR
jgi:histidinol-phosphatase (PHP family)